MTLKELYVYAWLAAFIAFLLYAGWRIIRDDPNADKWHRQHSLRNWHDPDNPDPDD